MICPKCKTANSDGHRYCFYCGERLGSVCPACGKINDNSARFCSDCEAPQIKIETINDVGSLSEERKRVSILFADVASSLEMLSDRDPEDAKILLLPVIEQLIGAINEYGGTVNNVMGDGVMAIFGAPIAYEDHASRACLAALQIQDRIKKHAKEINLSEGTELRVRIGVNSGTVIVGERGSGFDFQYAAFGETAHVASRMERLAQPGGIVISASTYKLARHNIYVKPRGATSVRGLNHPVEVFELYGANIGRTKNTLESDLTPFIGRESERRTLLTALRQVTEGNGRVLGLVGEPGAGKSRLVQEFLDNDVDLEWTVLKMGTVSYMRETPYFPLVGALRSFFGIDTDEDPISQTAKVTAKIKEFGISSETAQLAILSLFGHRDPLWQEIPAESRREIIIDTVTNIIIEENKERPILLILEDLQWVDSDTLLFLSKLIALIHSSRIFILLNYRPEFQHDWTSFEYHYQLPIESLDVDDRSKLLDLILGSDSSLEALKILISKRTGGNPFFIEETIRTLREEGALAGSFGSFALTKIVQELAIPTNVQDVLAMRIDRLKSEEKSVLQAAAVIGYEIDPPVLEGLVKYPREVLANILDNLNSSGFLFVSQIPQERYVFKHALSQDVAYSGLPREKKRQLHATIVDVLETLYGRQLERHVEIIAHHAVQGRRWDKAVGYLKKAGEMAVSRSACAAALAFFQSALEALTHISSEQVKCEYEYDLRLAHRHAMMPLGRHVEILPHLMKAEQLAHTLRDRQRLGHTLAHLCHCHWLLGDWKKAIAYGHEALNLAAELHDVSIQVWTRFFAGLAYFSLGEIPQAITLLTSNANTLTGELARQRFGGVSLPAVVTRGWLSWCLAETGEFDLAFSYAQEAEFISNMDGKPFDQIQAHLAIGGVFLVKGDYAQAIPPLEAALVICDSASIPILLPRAASALAYAYAKGGRLKDALPLAERAASQVRSMNLDALRSMCMRWVAEVELLDNRVDDALHNANQILEHCHATHERGLEAWTLHLLGTAHARRGSVDVAEEYFHQALEIAEALGMRPLAGHCSLSKAKLNGDFGKQANSGHEVAMRSEGALR